MFNGILKSDDVEVYEASASGMVSKQLEDNCKSNIIVISTSSSIGNLYLPNHSNIGKIINITVFNGVTATGKPIATSSGIYVLHSNSVLFTLKQGTVSFMYVGQQLNGLTATDKAKSGWIILGGVQGNIAITGYAGSIVFGSGASATNIGAIANGYQASAGGIQSIANGYQASANGYYGIAIGLSAATSDALYGVSLGALSNSICGKLSIKTNAQFSVAGDAQAGKFILMRETTSATPLVMSATNAAASTTNILILPNNGTYAFKGIVVAKDATTLDSAMWEVTALMKRGANASTTALVGTPTITKVFNDAGAAAWTIALTADTTNGGGVITVTGEAGKTIRFVCSVDSAEVI